MKWFGLTGGIACGKSTVTELLRKSSIPVVDADQVARKVVSIGSEGLKEIISYFGPDVQQADGTLNRKKLGELVFGDRTKTLALESILHPKIRAEVEKQKQRFQAQGYDFAVYDIPLLYETNSPENFDAVIVVTTTPEVQFKRMQDRGLNAEEVKRRLSSQWELPKKVSAANYVIHNDQDLKHLENEVQKLIVWLKNFKTSV